MRNCRAGAVTRRNGQASDDWSYTVMWSGNWGIAAWLLPIAAQSASSALVSGP